MRQIQWAIRSMYGQFISLNSLPVFFTLKALLIALLFASLVACQPDEIPAAPTQTAAPPLTATPPAPTPTPTPTPLPTETPVPLAAMVNGEGLPLAEFQAELKRFQESGTKLATEHVEDAGQFVLDDIINQMLLAQAAAQAGFILDDATLQARFDQLVAQIGGNQAMDEWMRLHQYTPDEFRQSLKRSIAAAWMRDQIIAAVPETAEQIHARQILLYNSKQAEEVLVMLQNGQDFAKLALNYDPISAGDLGWFPRGYLNAAAVEEAAFALQPGEYSQMIQTPLGFHLVQLIERDPQHPLSPDARFILQEQSLASWIQERREQSDLQIFIP